MTADQLASLAASLRDNEVFQLALTSQRNAALEGLASVDATDVETIRTLQATVRVVDDLRHDIEGFIRSGAVRKAPGIA